MLFHCRCLLELIGLLQAYIATQPKPEGSHQRSTIGKLPNAIYDAMLKTQLIRCLVEALR